MVSWIARIWRPLTSPAVRARAVATISSGLTRRLRKNRVKRISPARLPPTRRTLMPDWPTQTSRASKQAPLFPGAGHRTVPNCLPSAAPRGSLEHHRFREWNAPQDKRAVFEMCAYRRVKPGDDGGERGEPGVPASAPPNFFSDLDNQPQLRPLLVLGERIALLG